MVLAVAAMVLGLGPSSASATPGITNFWGSIANNGQTEGRRFAASGPNGIAIYEGTGDVYVADTANNRVQQFSADGAFIRAWGFDVNLPAASPSSSATFETCTVKSNCKAGVGGFIEPTDGLGGELSNPAGVAVNQVTGHVYVSDAGFRRIQEFTANGGFVRAFGQDVLQGGGTGFEVCTVAASCKAGVSGEGAGAFASMGYPTVVPAGGSAPNAGHLLVPDPTNRRVQEFSAEGAFVRAFGWDVVASGAGNDTTPPENEFEVCNAGGGSCKQGSSGSGAGQFGENAVNRVTEAKDGSIYTIEAANNATSGNLRIQRFSLPADVITPLGPFCGAGYVPGTSGGELCGTSSVSSGARDNPSEIAVDGAGFVYVVKALQVGTGNPPVVIAPGVISAGTIRTWQQRILKVDPAANGGTGKVIETMIANPGEAPGVEGDISTGVSPELLSGLTVSSAGGPIYFTAANGGISRQRVYRLDEISGLTASISVGEVSAATATLEGTIAPLQTTGAENPVKTTYHFEYSTNGTTWLKAPVTDVVIGNGSTGGDSSSCSAENQAAICHVSQELDGLDLEQTYQCRLVASTIYRGAVRITSEPCEFTTEAHPPSVITGSAVWSGPPTSGPSLAFNGRLNPQGARTAYFFQYVSEADFEASGYAQARTAPRVAADAGHGVITKDVVAVAAGLDPGSAYRFRLVASNPAGVTIGGEGTVAPPQADDRFYELVSDGDSQGSSLPEQRLTVSDDGNRAMFIAVAFGEQQGAPFITNPNIAERGPAGWAVKQMAPDPDLGGGGLTEGSGDAEVRKRLWLGTFRSGAQQWMTRNLDGTLTPLSSPISPLQREGTFSLKFEGASSDLRTLLFSDASSTLLPGEALVPSQGQGYSNLYELSDAGGASPTVSIVNRDGGGVIGGACGARLGSENGSGFTARTRAVSADGSVIHFSARAGAPGGASCNTAVPVRVFSRVGGASTIEVSACAKTPPATCTTAGDDFYWSASADGSRVYFSTARQLTDSDTDSGQDLYLYDSSPPAGKPNLIQVSAGEVVPGDHPVIGSGANVLGVSDVSMDGSRVYFVATGRLTAAAIQNANNLYVYERDAAHPDGRIGLVATLDSGTQDADLWSRSKIFPEGKPAYALPRYEGEEPSRSDGDGHLLVFLSRAQLLPAEDQDAFDDIYRYDDAGGQLACLSCIGDGAVDVRLYGQQIAFSNSDQVQQERIASEDGSEVVFTTREKLLTEDNNTVQDVYLWDAGQLSLVSGATGASGILGAGKDGVGGAAISPDGRGIFFLTRATLLPQDTDNGGYDYYVARVGGGFPQVEPATDPCNPDPEACRSQTTPALLLSPSTEMPGIEAPPKKCPRGKILRKGKCVKKHHRHRHHRKHRRTGSSGRAGR